MKILLAVDGSDCSKNAVHEIAARPWPKGSELRILSVAAMPLPYPIPDPFLVIEGSRINIMKDEHKRLNDFVESMRHAVDSSEFGKELEITTEVLEGVPKEKIVEAAEEWEADLIVVGSHGYGGVKRLFLGSVSLSVASHAHCSVEIVRCRHEHEKSED